MFMGLEQTHPRPYTLPTLAMGVQAAIPDTFDAREVYSILLSFPCYFCSRNHRA